MIKSMFFHPFLDIIIVISNVKFLLRALTLSVAIASARHAVEGCLIRTFHFLVRDCQGAEAVFAQFAHGIC